HAWKVCIRETVSRVRISPSPPNLLPMPATPEIFYVYILQSMKDFSFYVGQCADLDTRMSKHFDGMSKYTASKRPWRLVYFELFTSRSAALKRERHIKMQKSSKYINMLIENRYYFEK
ncbi:MAG: GIY-YIG nuclease family protein, partial [Chitinophagaceae bacterium]|nr:GIY-YIG nuclease family protein [Chitinophagaceae bacterium]